MKRLIATLMILFMLGVTGIPYLPWSGNSYFAYATEEQEELTTDQIIYAGITTYLNSRKAWIVNQTGNSIDTVQSVMQTWVNSYDFWKDTTVVNAAELAGYIIIKYSPFRVSLQGPAVRAFNDLYQWLVDQGKIPNADNSSGGETTDTLYNGYIDGNFLYYIFDDQRAGINLGNNASNGLSPQYVSVGSPVNGVNGDTVNSRYANSNGSDYWNLSNVSSPSISIRYSSDSSAIKNIERYNSTTSNHTNLVAPFLCITYPQIPIYSKQYGNVGCAAKYRLTSETSNQFHNGFVYYNPSTNKYYCYNYQSVYRYDSSAKVNLSTNNFETNDPVPPTGDNEIEYTPEVKETSGNYTAGDTFNTYNEYITNYVTKNTVINTSESGGGGNEEPEEPGGTTPPWTGDNQGTAGTLTPNGNGGYDLSLPDLTLPDLDIDWSINGLKDKFPFSIPWDLMAFFTVLNAEPETPHFDGTIPIGIWEWEIDWDLHYFDNLAILVRNLEFIAFCIGLIIVTRNIIKG